MTGVGPPRFSLAPAGALSNYLQPGARCRTLLIEAPDRLRRMYPKGLHLLYDFDWRG